jgi:hypothetical protein
MYTLSNYVMFSTAAMLLGIVAIGFSVGRRLDTDSRAVPSPSPAAILFLAVAVTAVFIAAPTTPAERLFLLAAKITGSLYLAAAVFPVVVQRLIRK